MSHIPDNTKATAPKKPKEEDQHLLHGMLQRIGVPNPWLEQQLPFLLEAGQKNASLQAEINNVMGDIHRLMAQGNSPENRAALGAAADKLQGLATRADGLNASVASTAGSSVAGHVGGGEIIGAGSARQTLDSASSASSSTGGVAHSGSSSSNYDRRGVNADENIKKKYLEGKKDEHAADDRAKSEGGAPSTTAKQNVSVTSDQTSASPDVTKPQANGTLSLKDRLKLAREKNPDASSSSGASTAVAGAAPKEPQAKAPATDKPSTVASVESSVRADDAAMPKGPSPRRANAHLASTTLKAIGGDPAHPQSKPAEVATAEQPTSTVSRPQNRVSSAALNHPAVA